MSQYFIHVSFHMITHNLFVLVSLYVWITWVFTNIWQTLHANSTFGNIFTEKKLIFPTEYAGLFRVNAASLFFSQDLNLCKLLIRPSKLNERREYILWHWFLFWPPLLAPHFVFNFIDLLLCWIVEPYPIWWDHQNFIGAVVRIAQHYLGVPPVRRFYA